MGIADPTAVLDRGDPGDDTQLRFRYQHGYGVILLCGAATGALPYVAVWCEHHEDLLGEMPNGQFDSFQIKTATPESGPWKMSSEKLWKSIGRFVQLDEKFPGKFDAHSFVSNVKCFDTDQPAELGKSPIKFFRALKVCATCEDLETWCATALQDLAAKLKRDKTQLLETCKRVQILKGPALDGFEISIAHEHLPKVEGCAKLSPAELDGLRDELIQKVFNASSVAIDDPSKHWCCVLGNDHINPRLKAKRLVAKDTTQDAIAGRTLVFRFAPSSTSLRLGEGKKDLEILAKKLVRGNLASQLDPMQSRTLSAEQHLLTLVAQDADNAGKVINQLKELVQGTCTDAEAIASANPEPWGLEMYRRVVTRLQNVADNQPDMVHRQPHECLMGIAGLLTEECKVWWSPKFDVEEAE
jgi:Cap4 dsDNA endonuclease